MNILVIGGNGFIGRHVCSKLVKQGYQVSVYDRNTHESQENITTFCAELDDIRSLSKALEGIDCVVHLASTTVPSSSNLDPVGDVNGNLINMLRLLNLMLEKDIKRIIYFSSGGTVYGIPEKLPIKESHQTNPICSYGIIKLAIEKYLLMYHQLHEFDVTILRPSNPYGLGQAKLGLQGVIGTAISCALDKKKMTIWGDGTVVRDYVHVSDVAEACLLSVQSQVSGTFNISSGKGTSVSQIVQLVQEVTGKDIQVEYTETRTFDVPEVVLDFTNALSKLNWSPKLSLIEGVTQTVNSYMLNRRA